LKAKKRPVGEKKRTLGRAVKKRGSGGKSVAGGAAGRRTFLERATREDAREF
jgi:hypothetical protein